MNDNYLLQGKIQWIYSNELIEISDSYKVLNSIISFSPPLHKHRGLIALNEEKLLIEGFDGDIDIEIRLSAIKQIYMGFDDLFPASSVKSFGAFWQPLRVEFYITPIITDVIYIIIDYNGVFSKNHLWFDTLKTLLD